MRSNRIRCTTSRRAFWFAAFFAKHGFTLPAAAPLSKKVPLGSTVRLQAPSLRFTVATNFFRVIKTPIESCCCYTLWRAFWFAAFFAKHGFTLSAAAPFSSRYISPVKSCCCYTLRRAFWLTVFLMNNESILLMNNE